MRKKTAGKKVVLRGEELDPATKARRAVLADMKKMTPKELFELAVRAGIYTRQGELTRPYQAKTPSGVRPKG